MDFGLKRKLHKTTPLRHDSQGMVGNSFPNILSHHV